MDVIITSDRIANDPAGRGIIEHLTKKELQLNLEKAILYYDFPTFPDYEATVHRPDIFLITKTRGLIAIKYTLSEDFSRSKNVSIQEIDESISDFANILIGRFLKSKLLRIGKGRLKFEITPIIFQLGAKLDQLETETVLATSYENLDRYISTLNDKKLNEDEISEIRSIIEGAKALMRPHKRQIENPEIEHKAVALAKLESEIANFDEKQRRTALSVVVGPQRIRGLAGSGKTVILAMKAAHLHLTNPDKRILVTFYTKSLKNTLESLISKFYRHYKDEEPDWEMIHVRHGWGNSKLPGVYSQACTRHNLSPISFTTAQQKSRDPFDYVCKELGKAVEISPYYDHILIDEGQDFPRGFYELCFDLAHGERDKKSIIWAYDELQNILNVNIRTPSELFGVDDDGLPKISLERAAKSSSVQSDNDIVLSKCYRNQREVLVIAHALGFGLYSEIVQLLQNEAHWRDVGYEINDGDLKIEKNVKIFRPEENSPVSVSSDDSDQIINFFTAKDIKDEIDWIVAGIREFLAQGLLPTDILVVVLDDRNAKNYLLYISQTLAEHGIESNNLLADPYSEPAFQLEHKVTLSTVYRAKGNEAAAVFVCGIDAIGSRTRGGRNKIFTAFTRSKAWLRVSGMGENAEKYFDEIKLAQNKFPYLEFKMPDPEQVDMIQRDLSEKHIKAKKITEKYKKDLREIGLSDDEIPSLVEGVEKKI